MTYPIPEKYDFYFDPATDFCIILGAENYAMFVVMIDTDIETKFKCRAKKSGEFGQDSYKVCFGVDSQPTEFKNEIILNVTPGGWETQIFVFDESDPPTDSDPFVVEFEPYFEADNINYNGVTSY